MNKDYLIPLPEIVNVDLAGTKGKNLHRLKKSRFNVPLTFCLTTKAYEHFIDHNKLRDVLLEILHNDGLTVKEKSLRIRNVIAWGTVPDEIEQAIRFHKILTREVFWAVRSTSNMEDLPGASFAGLYDSYLDITGLKGISGAIKKCWASLWNERAIGYREKNGMKQEFLTMAVLIQQMVEPVYSGVIFTKSPAGGNPDLMVSEYCRGKGEKLISGKEPPIQCEIDRKNRTIHRAGTREAWEPEDEKIRELADLALNIETLFGSPQDIEWAFDGSTFFILQARPVSDSHLRTEARESGSAVTVGPEGMGIWTRANIGEVLPGVVTPLTWAVFQTVVSGNHAFITTGNDEERIDGLKRIRGRVYIGLKEFLDSFCYLPFVTPETMSRVLGVDAPDAVESYRPPRGVPVRLAQAVFFLDIVRVFRRISVLVKKLPPLPSLENLEMLIDWACGCFRLHLKSTAYAVGAYAYLARFLKRRFPTEVEDILPVILTGHEHLQTAAQGITLRNLSTKSFWESRTLFSKRVLAAGGKSFKNPSVWSHMEKELSEIEGGAEFLKLFRQFMDANGARAAGEFELAVPRWREDPSFVLDMIGKFMETSSENTEDGRRINSTGLRRRREEYIKRIESRLNPPRRMVFKRLLESYSDFTTFRENIKYKLMEGFALMRGYFLEKGDVLCESGKIGNRDDIFFLKPHEITALMANSDSNNFRSPADLVVTRKKEQALWASKPPRALIFEGATEPVPSSSESLSGIGCSPGTVEGVARVLYDLSESRGLVPDEILVTPHTDPGWTPLFLVCKAVVTEIGGFLSHGATVAREYGIPAVVNVPEAASRIETGDLIRVNGTTGSITILAKYSNRNNTAESAEDQG